MAKKKYTPEATIDLLYNQLMSDYKGDAQAEAERQRQKSAEKKASGNSTNSSTSAQNTLQSPSAVSRGASTVGNIYKAPKRKYTTGKTTHGYTTARSFAKDQTTKPSNKKQNAFERAGKTALGATQQFIGGHISSAGTALQTQEVTARSIHNQRAESEQDYRLRSRREAEERERRIQDDLRRKEGIDTKDALKWRKSNFGSEVEASAKGYNRGRVYDDVKPVSLNSREEALKRANEGIEGTMSPEALGVKEGVYLKGTEKVYDRPLPKEYPEFDEYSPSQKVIGLGDRFIESGSKKIEEAKEGASRIGKLALDLEANAIQMLGDRTVAFVPVFGQALAMGSLMSRAGGTASYEARQEGMNPDQQYAYALSTSLVEGLSEGIFNSVSAFQSTYGKGMFSLADRVSTRVASSKIVANVFKTEAGRIVAYNLARLGAEGFEEGFEEVVADIVEPALKYAIKKGADPTVQFEGYDPKQIAYDYLVGSLMAGIPGSVETGRNIRMETSQAYRDGMAHADEVIARGLVQGREATDEGATRMPTNSEILARQMQAQQESGLSILPGQTRQLQSEIAKDAYQNAQAFAEKAEEAESQANITPSTGTLTESVEVGTRSTALEKQSIEEAKQVMGAEASEKSAGAVGKVKAGTAKVQDHDTILADPKAREAVEEMTGITLPIKNTEARNVLENLTLSNMIANRDTLRKEVQSDLAEKIAEERSQMNKRGGEMFAEHYDEALQGLQAFGSEAGMIYESVFTRLFADGTIRDANFEDSYDSIVAPLGSTVTSYFTKDFARQIFNEGRIKLESDLAKSVAKSKAISAERAGTVTYLHDTKSRLSSRQKETIEKFAQRTNVAIEFYDGKQEGQDDDSNGWYKDGVIHININSTRKLITVAKHELTHHIKATSPELYRKLEDFVFERWYHKDRKMMEEAIRQKQMDYGDIDVIVAREEIIADASEAFFTDRGAINDVILFSKKLGMAIHDGIRTMLDSFLDVQDTDDLGYKGYGEFLKDLKILKDAQRMWLEALDQSVNRGRGQNASEATEADTEVRRSLKDIGMTLKDGNARWTDERIDRLIDEFGASNPDYSRAYAVLMNPRDFLKLTLSDEELNNWNERSAKVDPIYGDQRWLFRKLDTEELKNEKQTPFLEIYSKDGTMVQGHEGRHRMRALLEAGVKSVPVVIRDTDTKYTKKPLGSMTLSSQDFGYDPVNNGAEITIKDLVPIKESNRAELVEKFGGEAEVRFSKKDDQDYLDAVNRGDMETAQRMVDEQARKAGYNLAVYHGTGEYFNVFNRGSEGIHLGNKEQASQVAKNRYKIKTQNSRYTWDEIKKNFKNLDEWDKQLLLADIADRVAERVINMDDLFKGDINNDTEFINYMDDVTRKIAHNYHDIQPTFYMRTIDRKVGEHLMALYAKISNPFIIDDDVQGWYPNVIADIILLRSRGETTYRSDYYLDGVYNISGEPITLSGEDEDRLSEVKSGNATTEEGWDIINDVLNRSGGYDGIKYLNKYEGDKNSYSYIALKPSDVKSADPVTYDDNGNVIPLSERFNEKNEDIRYSRKDSDGNTLTEAQAEYFKDSKARDEDGNLLVMYHSSPNKFTIFDRTRLGETSGFEYGNTAYGFFVTDYKPFSNRFGKNEMKLYANITKPITHPFMAHNKYDDAECERITRDWLEVIDPDQFETYEIYKESEPDLTLYEFYMNLWEGEDPFDYAEYDRETLEEAGYDAVEICEGHQNELGKEGEGNDVPVTTYAVFNSNQLKNVTNKKPTDNPDIRLSKKDQELDAQYMDAVKKGDMETAQRMVDEYARKAGYDVKAYHGTSNFGFTKFSTRDNNGNRIETENGKVFGNGFYFTDNKDVAEKRYANVLSRSRLVDGEWVTEKTNRGVYNVYLNLGNNYVLDWNDTKGMSQRDFDRLLRDIWKDHNSLTIKNIRDGIDITSTVYVVEMTPENAEKYWDTAWSSSRIKSADPVTYDDNGNVIPLSERFNAKNEDIRFSKKDDQDYFDAVNRGDMETAQRMVDEYAKSHGWKPRHTYHGTLAYGFTVFDKAKAQVGGNSGAGFYFSTEMDDSVNHYADEEGADNFFKRRNLAERIFDYVSETGEDWEGHYIETYEDAEEVARELLNKESGTYDVYLKYDNPYTRNDRFSTNIYEDIMSDFDESLINRDDYDSDEDYEDDLYMYRDEHLYSAIDSAVRNALTYMDEMYEVVDFPSDRAISNLVGDICQTSMDYGFMNWNGIQSAINDNDVYIQIAFDDEYGADGSTELVRAIIEELGYDAIIDKEVSRKFGQLSREMMTDTEHIIVFHPQQIKSADPVTYDDNGNVIPLSERFNEKNNDIRWSHKTEHEALPKARTIPKKIKDRLIALGADKLGKGGLKAPIQISVRDLRTLWYNLKGSEEGERLNTVLEVIGDELQELAGKYRYVSLADALEGTIHYRVDENGKPTSIVLSCKVKNAEYDINFDFTTICAKRAPLQKVLERFIKTEGKNKGETLYDELKLDEEGLYTLRSIMEQEGFDVSCIGCFVEQNRYAQQTQSKTVADDWNKALDEWAKEHGVEITEGFDFQNLDIDQLPYSEIQKGFRQYSALMKGKPTTVENKNKALIEAIPYLRKRLGNSDYASIAGQRAMMAMGNGKTNLYNLLKRGQGDSKQSTPFVPYNGEVALLPETKKGKKIFDYLFGIGGARAQSASDFQIEYVFDYMQLVGDLSARGLPMHMYTKVIECAELLGMCGIKINLSAMCDVDSSVDGEYAGLKRVNGKWVYNISKQSIDYERAVKLQRKEGYRKNIGIIMVVLSKQHMLKALSDADVRYIIGYHSSKMPPIVARASKMEGATDYTKLNKTNRLNDKGRALFTEAMSQAKGKTELEKYKDALRIFDDLIQTDKLKTRGEVPRRGNEYTRYMSSFKANTADFDVYDDIKKTNDPRTTADNYIRYCMENDLVPMYFPFAFHENYYKCEVYDYNVYDNETGEYAPMEAVQNIYPELNIANGETDTKRFMAKVRKMVKRQNKKNAKVEPKYEAVERRAIAELSITGNDYMDMDASGIDHAELEHRVDMTEEAVEERRRSIKEKELNAKTIEYQSTIRKLEKNVEGLKAQFKRTNKKPNPVEARRQAGRLIQRHASNMRIHEDVANTLTEIYEMYAKRGAKAFDDIYAIAERTAVEIVNNISEVHFEGKEEYDQIKEYLRDNQIVITDEMKRNITDFNDFRKRYFGKLKLVNGTTGNIDSVYQELNEMFPTQFTEDYINPADQLNHIADVLDSYAPFYETLDGTSEEMQDYVVEVASDLMETAYNLQNKKTFADKKYDEKVKAVKKAREKALANKRQALSELREKYEQRMADAIRTTKAETRAETKAKINEKAEKKRRIAQISKIHKRLTEKLFEASDTKHLPDGYNKVVADVLEMFDFTTTRMEKWAEKHEQPSERMLAMLELRQRLQEYAKAYETGDSSNVDLGMEVDTDLLDIVDNLEKALGKNVRLSDLSSATLEDIAHLFRAFERQLNSYNRAFTEGRRETITQSADKVVAEAREQKHGKWRTGIMGRVFTSNLNPSDFFTMMGGEVEQLYKNVRKGFDTYEKHLATAREYIQKRVDSKTAEKWANHKQTFTTTDGEKITLTDTQLMSLYCLVKREQAQGHIFGQGIVSAPVRVKKGLKAKTLDESRVVPTEDDVVKWLNTLSKDQIEFAEAIQKFFVDEISEWGNETSMNLYGYKKFTEKNYFPIQSSNDFLNSNFDAKGSDPTLKNISPTKALVKGANNPIMIDDIFSVFAKHTAQMASYNAYVPSITDFQRVWNYKMESPSGRKTTVKEVFKQTYGDGITRYVEHFFQDLNGVYKKNLDITAGDKLFGLFKKSAVGGNLRVLTQQPMAIARAMLVVDPVLLSASVPKTAFEAKKAYQEMLEHCPIAEWKTWGFYSMDITGASRDLKNVMIGKDTLSDKVFMNMYGVADNITWTCIFNACKLQVERQNKGIKKGSQEYWNKVNELASEVFDRTQVVDSPFHRSELMKSQDTGKKYLTMFMAEPTKTINMLNTELTLTAREISEGKIGKATLRFTRLTATTVANAMLLAVGQSVIDAMRSAGGGSDDDDKGDFEERFKKHWMTNTKDNLNVANMIPLVKDVMSLIDGYGVTRPDMMGIEKCVKAVQRLKKYYDNPDESTYTQREVMTNTALTFMYVLGVPLTNAKRDLESIALTGAEAVDNPDVFLWYMKNKYQVNKNTQYIWADAYYDALDKGNKALAKNIYAYMIKNGVEESYIQKREKTWRKHRYGEDSNGTDSED